MTSRPNILFLIMDDQRFDTIAALGNQDIITPNLDDLVARGTTFTHAHNMGSNCAAVCMPSRAMLHTGRTLFHLQDGGRTIPDEHTLLGETLQTAGYRTFGTGKWHNGTDSYARSFTDGDEIFFGGMNDHWNVPTCHFRLDGDYPAPRTIHCRYGALLAKDRTSFDHIATGKHSTDLFADAAAEFIANYDTAGPYAVSISMMGPHDPREMPARFLSMYDPEQLTLPPNFRPEHPFDNGELDIRDELLAKFPRDDQEARKHIAEYYAMVTHLDEQIGRLMDLLKQKGTLDDTIVVFSADHGLALGQHGLMGKQNLYDHSVRIPLLMAGVGIPEGERRDTLCYLLDVFPTICDLLDVPTPESVEGRSLVPALKDPTVRVRDEVLLAYRDVQRGVSDGRHKLIEYVVDGRRTTQLFNLAEDPWEMTDLADDLAYASTRKRLTQLLRKWPDELDDANTAFWHAVSPIPAKNTCENPPHPGCN